MKVEFFVYLEDSALENVRETVEVESADTPDIDALSDMADEFANRMEDLHGGYAISYGWDIVL